MAGGRRTPADVDGGRSDVEEAAGPAGARTEMATGGSRQPGRRRAAPGKMPSLQERRRAGEAGSVRGGGRGGRTEEIRPAAAAASPSSPCRESSFQTLFPSFEPTEETPASSMDYWDELFRVLSDWNDLRSSSSRNEDGKYPVREPDDDTSSIFSDEPRNERSAANDDATSVSDDDISSVAVSESEYHSCLTCSDLLESQGADPQVYARLEEAVRELEQKVLEESTKQHEALLDLDSALQKVKELYELYDNQIRQRISVEETLVRQTREIEETKTKCETISDKLDNAEEQVVMLEKHITDMESTLKQHQEKLTTSNYLLQVLEEKNKTLQQEKDAAEELRQKNEQRISVPPSTEFFLPELQQATQDFHEDLKIGEGKFGFVYKGSLRKTSVAIMLLYLGQSEFNLEVAFLNRVRHPNLVTLIGFCREACGLVYEFLPNGSLEDRLACTNNMLPLTWQERTRIIAEMCSALTFFHLDKPHPVVHGDLKPANILLDASFVSKLVHLSICHLPRETSPYTDPEFVSTGELTPRSDVYSLGIMILQLLTGRSPQKIAKVVNDAIKKDELHLIIDPSAGSWPYVQAKQLAYLGLRCAKRSSTRRPDLGQELWVVVESLMKAASSTARQPSFAGALLDDDSTPSDFLCPIFQEVMGDPCIAADGFTYEAEAIRGWLDGGHDTSPMTNLKLQHLELTPNRTLHSAIVEWQQ